MKLRHAIATAAVVLSSVPLTVAAGTTASAADPVAGVRRATARYHQVSVALADGYLATDQCVELPGVGGMGMHYVSPARLSDGVLDATRPEVLLYAPNGAGEPQLVAVEYFQPDADQNLGTDGDRPSLLGHAFDGPMPGHSPDMPIHYDLHVWVWAHNPAGMFESWNPVISC